MRKTPYLTDELFDEVWKRITQKYPECLDIIDYALPAREAVEARETPTLKARLEYGGNEGIYLDVFAEFYEEQKGTSESKYATIKSLDESDDAFLAMGELFSRLVIETKAYVKDNYQDFRWNEDGDPRYIVEVYEDDGRYLLGRYCKTLDEADEYVNQVKNGSGRPTKVFDLEEREEVA